MFTKNKNIFFDDQIEKIFENWENHSSDEFSVILKRAMHYHISPLLYRFFRGSITGTIQRRKSSYLKRFNTLNDVLNHVFLTFIWSLKYILFLLFFRKKDIILCSFNTNRAISRNYLTELLKYAIEKKMLVVQVGVFSSYHLLFNLNLFAVPTLFYRFSQNLNNYNSFILEFWDSLKSSIPFKMLNINNIRRESSKYLIMYIKLFYYFSNILIKIRKNRKILFFVQDGDYTSTKIIFTYASKIANLVTISIDHSVIIYEHLYKQTISDFCLVWGEYSKNRIRKLSIHKPRIFIIGRPSVNHFELKIREPLKYIIHFLPCFQDPMLESINRSIEYSLEIVDEMQKVLNDRYPDISILVKPHPLDSRLKFGRLSLIKTRKQFLRALKVTKLFTCEDTTITIELLNYPQPLLYVLDNSKKDRYKFSHFGLQCFVTTKDQIKNSIERIFEDNIKVENKKRMIEYYFGRCERNANGLVDILNKNICG